MMYLQMVVFRIGFGDRSEAVGKRVKTDGEGHMLRQQIAYLFRREPLRLRRLPVEEKEIGVLLVGGERRVSDTFLVEFLEDTFARVIVHGVP